MTNEPCAHCLKDVRVTAWDKLVGLPVRCGSCGAWSGPRWTATRLVVLIVASLCLNVLVLFFIVRPGRALSLIVMYVVIVAILLTSAAGLNEAVFGVMALLAWVAPACLVAIEYFHHERVLLKVDVQATPPTIR